MLRRRAWKAVQLEALVTSPYAPRPGIQASMSYFRYAATAIANCMDKRVNGTYRRAAHYMTILAGNNKHERNSVS